MTNLFSLGQISNEVWRPETNCIPGPHLNAVLKGCAWWGCMRELLYLWISRVSKQPWTRNHDVTIQIFLRKRAAHIACLSPFSACTKNCVNKHLRACGWIHTPPWVGIRTMIKSSIGLQTRKSLVHSLPAGQWLVQPRNSCGVSVVISIIVKKPLEKLPKSFIS